MSCPWRKHVVLQDKPHLSTPLISSNHLNFKYPWEWLKKSDKFSYCNWFVPYVIKLLHEGNA